MVDVENFAPIFHQLLPLMALRGCKSGASSSINGPRFIAQDRFTGLVHEVRVLKLLAGRPSKAIQQRLKSLQDAGRLAAPRSPNAAASLVSLPEDAYTAADATGSGAEYAIAVGPQCGMSLHDLMSQERTAIARRHFEALLAVISRFLAIHESLPVHGNVSLDCVMLTMESDGDVDCPGAAVAWCIGDWSLADLQRRPPSAARTIEQLVGAFMSVLSVFVAQLRVVDLDGAVMPHRSVIGQISDALSADGMRRYMEEPRSPFRREFIASVEDCDSPSGLFSSFERKLRAVSCGDAASPSGSSRSLERVVDAHSAALTSDLQMYEEMRRKARHSALRDAQETALLLSASSPLRYVVQTSSAKKRSKRPTNSDDELNDHPTPRPLSVSSSPVRDSFNAAALPRADVIECSETCDGLVTDSSSSTVARVVPVPTRPLQRLPSRIPVPVQGSANPTPVPKTATTSRCCTVM